MATAGQSSEAGESGRAERFEQAVERRIGEEMVAIEQRINEWVAERVRAAERRLEIQLEALEATSGAVGGEPVAVGAEAQEDLERQAEEALGRAREEIERAEAESLARIAAVAADAEARIAAADAAQEREERIRERAERARERAERRLRDAERRLAEVLGKLEGPGA